MGGNWLTRSGKSLDNTHQITRRRVSSQSKKSMKSGRKGQDLVEFAIAVPLLLLLLFGAIDLGRLFHASITITNAARVGARYITMDPYPNDSGVFDIAKGLAVKEAQDSGIQISYDNVGNPVCQISFGGRCAPLEPVKLSVSYDFQLLLGPILPGGFVVPGNPCPDGRNLCFTLTRTAEMLVQ